MNFGTKKSKLKNDKQKFSNSVISGKQELFFLNFCAENKLRLDFPIENIYFNSQVCYFNFQPGFSNDKAYMKADICYWF